MVPTAGSRLRPFHRRPARGRQHGLSAWLIIFVLLIGAVIGGALAAMWVLKNVDARLLLTAQPAQLSIPEPFEASARVTDALRISLDETIQTRVPVDVALSLPIRDTLNVEADFDGMVPIKLDVTVKDTITIDQVLDVDAVVDANFLGDWHKLPIRGKIPVKARVPINLVIPVDQLVHLRFTAPVKARVLENINVQLKTVIDAAIPIQSTMDVPVLSDLKAVVTVPGSVNAVIDYADLLLPLRTLTLGVRDEGGGATPGPVGTGTPP